jgi:hypothetical protein
VGLPFLPVGIPVPLKYYYPSSRDQPELIVVLEDEDISQRQAEDLQLFGSRPKPLGPEDAFTLTAESVELDRPSWGSKKAASALDGEEVEHSPVMDINI